MYKLKQCRTSCLQIYSWLFVHISWAQTSSQIIHWNTSWLLCHLDCFSSVLISQMFMPHQTEFETSKVKPPLIRLKSLPKQLIKTQDWRKLNNWLFWLIQHSGSLCWIDIHIIYWIAIRAATKRYQYSMNSNRPGLEQVVHTHNEPCAREGLVH